jgi:hypothetical protein
MKGWKTFLGIGLVTLAQLSDATGWGFMGDPAGWATDIETFVGLALALYGRIVATTKIFTDKPVEPTP